MLLFIFEMIGTIAFAVSGALVAIKRKMDIFGVAILGMTTAVGGGIFRDLILGATPPSAFVRPVYALSAIVTSLIVFIPSVRRMMLKNSRAEELILLVTDSLGLGVFTMNGIDIAFAHVSNATIFLAVFVGVCTGVGGGVVRDIFAGETPAIFRKHFYATASLIGALLCCLLWNHMTYGWAMLCGASSIVILRFLAAHYRWTLPRA